jgi:hypothetical protein
LKYFPLIQPAIDSNGVITEGPTDNFDGGDTAQREGMFAFAAYVLHQLCKMDDQELTFCKDRYAKVLSQLDDPNHKGLLRRYPNLPFWGAYSDRLSRDQMTSNIVAMGCMNQNALKSFIWAHLKYRGLLFLTDSRINGAYPPGTPQYNASTWYWKLPDLTILDFHGMYIRGLKAWPLYPLLLISDLAMPVNALIKVLSYGKTNTNNDDLSFLMELYQAQISMPTIWSKLAKWIYKFRPYPANPGNASNPAQACMNAYFNGTNPGPRLDLVYQEVNDSFSK